MRNFTQTRGTDHTIAQQKNFEEAIFDPSASFGGLYTLEKIPCIDFGPLKSLSYPELVQNIFTQLGIQLNKEILKKALEHYKSFDDPQNPAPLVKIHNQLYAQELYHGPTRAFKDMALQPFGSVFSQLAHQQGKKYLILTATSGDTGPATLKSFADQENIFVLCLYPQGGTSDVQALQMTTQNAKNLKVLGIKGDFDTAQNILKSLLQDTSFKETLKAKQISLSAANSVNFGRIAFQIIYHIWGYFRLLESEKIPYGKAISIVVPSGNFGNALGAFYAKMMGLPIQKIIIASNANNILTEFFQTGIYDIRTKQLIKTTSPAMDILKSSNIERLLFALFGPNRTHKLMENLESKHYYQLTPAELQKLQEHFLATACSDSACLACIKESFENGYLLDPHTATALKAAQELAPKDLVVICSTAEWSKFAPTMTKALFDKDLSDKEAIKYLCEEKNIPVPQTIQKLFAQPIIHQDIVDPTEVKSVILQWLSDIL
ncbi:threonine synthase [Helicobacter sp. 12S02634-8]|uniref:threonine synthase n=1 Tax=Helicobacter sp. 12S02634-8 TaxID=1476199 RepID=UPI000BA7AC85|nr:threonine synthase [Helicobacter sp. 12S02634-8]PAF46674.1 threonine synthase [Helicobacter sp. 12S02634-8]